MPAAEHATVVQRWIDAGLVIFGKTNTPEFGAKGITEPERVGPGAQSVGPGADTGRLLGRIGGRGRRRHRAVRGRERRWRIDPYPGGVLRSGRPQTGPRD